MKVKKQMIPLISAIEYKIGKSCYNAESYNGWTDEYGCSFRYPIVYEVKDEEDDIHIRKTRLSIESTGDINAENLRTVCYKFGANELSIGGAVVDVLNMLEARYGINFEELEKEYQKSKAEKK